MDDNFRLASGMQVLTSDGELIGTVDAPADDGFMLRRMNAPGDPQAVPSLWIHRIDQHVHLNRSGAETIAGWKSMSFKTSTGVEPARADVDNRPANASRSWLIWLVLILVLLVVAALLWTTYGNG